MESLPRSETPHSLTYLLISAGVHESPYDNKGVANESHESHYPHEDTQYHVGHEVFAGREAIGERQTFLRRVRQTAETELWGGAASQSGGKKKNVSLT